jgi:hypothetical protein
MKATPGLAATNRGPRSEFRGTTLESRRWPVEDRQLVHSLFGSASSDLLEALPHLPYASKTGRDVLLSCLGELRDRYLHAHGLRGNLHFETDAVGLGVPESPLRSILEHLVEGALRDNPSADPFCHVGVCEKHDGFVTLYLRDNGRELPECSLEALRRFVREAKPEQVPDRIYRLFLADNLVQWLGGRMWIGPTPNGAGSSVFLRLPRAAAAHE